MNPDYNWDHGYLETMCRSYATTALWSSIDEQPDGNGGPPLDEVYDASDIHADSWAKMYADCAAFMAKMDHAELSEYPEAAQVGHDFWLTRNGHGAGFWDGDYPDDDGDILTAIAKAFGAAYLIAGDDGAIHHY